MAPTFITAALAALVVYFQWRSLSVGVAAARKETSRYPLYAARDELVRIVAIGALSEDNPAWRHAYLAVNRLLAIHQKLDAFSIVRRAARFRELVKADPRLRHRIELDRRRIAKATRDCPEFAEALRMMNAAFSHAVAAQTSGVQHAALAVWAKVLHVRESSAAQLNEWSAYVAPGPKLVLA
jgi:hypothetical protein